MVMTVPSPKSSADSARWAHTSLVRRILNGEWESDVEGRLRLAIGDVKREAWGPIDLSACPLRVCADSLSRSYDVPPAIMAPDEAGAEVTKLVTRSGHWARMPLVQRDAWAEGEVYVRVDLDAYGEPTYRIVHGDRLTAEPDPEHPDRPIILRELVRRRVDGEPTWTWDVYDLTDPAYPTFRIYKDEKGDLGAELTNLFFSIPLEGESYPYRYENGRPYIPYVIYRATESGGLWHPYLRREITEGTLNVAMYYTFFGHIVRDASWPQRFVVDLELSGASRGEPTSPVLGPDGRPVRKQRSQLVTDPATVAVLRSLADATGQPQVGQWQPGGDPMVIIEAVGVYERRLASYAGITGSDQMRMSGDPRSGFAIAVSRTTLREQMRRIEPLLRRADEELLRMTAAMLSRHRGTRYPESGYEIVYQGVPESPEEREARREHVIALLDKGLMDRVAAYQAMHPGVSRAEAEEAIERIARINRATQ